MDAAHAVGAIAVQTAHPTGNFFQVAGLRGDGHDRVEPLNGHDPHQTGKRPLGGIAKDLLDFGADQGRFDVG